MVVKFNLDLSKSDRTELMSEQYYAKLGSLLKDEQHNCFEKVLSEYVNGGVLDASLIESDWFPEYKAHVFISHSHKDIDLVSRLAGFLLDKYKIVSFVDSTVWGYADDLLDLIDNEYNTLETESGKILYDRDLVRRSAAHIYLLLQGAILKMINKCDCLIFVNTPNSIKLSDIENDNRTASPWIYNELLIANTIPVRKRRNIVAQYASPPQIEYKVNLEEFCVLKLSDFENAQKVAKSKKPEKLLDQLYVQKGIWGTAL